MVVLSYVGSLLFVVPAYAELRGQTKARAALKEPPLLTVPAVNTSESPR